MYQRQVSSSTEEMVRARRSIATAELKRDQYLRYETRQRHGMWNRKHLLCFFAFMFLLVFGLIMPFYRAETNRMLTVWIGKSEIDIVPKNLVWLSGFASRKYAPDTNELLVPWAPLKARALALSRQRARRPNPHTNKDMLVFITLDLIGIDKTLSDRIFQELNSLYGLSRSNVRLIFSHTHSGPVVGDNLFPLAPKDTSEQDKIKNYAEDLIYRISKAVGEAISSESMQRVHGFFGKGSCGIAVNRRQVSENQFLEPNRGLTDPEVPVMWFRTIGKSSRIIAGLYGYAAHATILTSSNRYSGDYPSAVSVALEKSYPESTWLYLPGTGGDINIYPRGNVSMLMKHRDSLVTAVKNVVEEKNQENMLLRNSDTDFVAISSKVRIPFRCSLSFENVMRMSRSRDAISSATGKRLLNNMKRDEQTASHYLYPISLWTLGNIRVAFLGGEPTVEYGLRLKGEAGVQWTVGYTDDVMGYVGSKNVLLEGKREGSDRAAIYYGLPCTWSPTVDDVIRTNVSLLVEQITSAIRGPKMP